MQKAGKIRHFGFSFHDNLTVFKEIIAAHDWEFCQIQYNYLDRYDQAGLEGLRLAHAKGIGIIIMEPLRGGNLVSPLPGNVRELMEAAPRRRSAVEWALGWVFNHPEVSLVLSGMSTMEQLEENLAIAGSVGAGSFTSAELALIDKAEECTAPTHASVARPAAIACHALRGWTSRTTSRCGTSTTCSARAPTPAAPGPGSPWKARRQVHRLRELCQPVPAEPRHPRGTEEHGGRFCVLNVCPRA